MPIDPPVLPPAAPQLPELLSFVHAARADVSLLRSGRVDVALLIAARDVLLDATERYAAELVRRRLPMPPGLRDDLRLQRRIRGQHRSGSLRHR
jgi:hypothetical protein